MINYETDSYPSLLLRPESRIRSSLLREVSPLEYTLQEADFHTFNSGRGLPDEVFLDQATGMSMSWALKRVVRYLFRAARAQVVYDPNLPAGVYPHIPSYMFELLGLPPPRILALAYMDTVNILSMLAPKPVVEALWCDFQAVGNDAIAWVDSARERCRRLGSSCGWDWEEASTGVTTLPKDSEMTIPDWVEGTTVSNLNILQTNPEPPSDPVPSNFRYTFPTRELSPITITSGSDYSMSDNEVDHIFNNCQDVVLHPQLSRIATLDPAYNVFGGQDLVDQNNDLIIVGQY